jgi:hypothetical protein
MPLDARVSPSEDSVKWKDGGTDGKSRAAREKRLKSVRFSASGLEL